MKIRFLVWVALFAACNSSSEPITQNLPIGLTKAPLIELGAPIPDDLQKEDHFVLFFSNTFHESYAWRDKEIAYTLLAYPDTREIHSIYCSDERFRTPEGVRVGQTFSDVKRASESDCQRMAGFGYWVPLPSGWNAVFFQGDSLTDGPLVLEAKVKLVAKSSLLWD